MNLINNSFYLMDNVVQHYEWGSKDALNALFGIENSTNTPQAEVWMGAHSKGSSKILLNQKIVTLSEIIQHQPMQILDPQTLEKYGELPYLFKVLTAEKALSIQVHPSRQQAIEGFTRENQLGIPLDAPQRNYKDPNHKPELVYALTKYTALNGFRHYQEIIDNFRPFKHIVIQGLVDELDNQPDADGLESFFAGLLGLEEHDKHSALIELNALAQKNANHATFDLVNKLSQQYPNDIGQFAPLLLNVITLEPGQAMYLAACTPHAYVHGSALEIMANSDNVLRAGLTPKHIDVPELIHCTQFEPTPYASLITEAEHHSHSDIYPTPVDDFCFAILNAPQAVTHLPNSAEILFAIDSAATITDARGNALTFQPGQSILIPAHTETYTITSQGRVARAYN
ncbi:mannose-6-phosphate isomerase, class I [Vibrio sp. WXL103]|uniref:mannose-6-phosphate isomerase, class I n=1 Tax=Vibrio sp. WXL103 TaxID=3450710 RepID=UPI003EC58F82